MATRTITVRAANTSRVALWDRDPAYKGGELSLAGTGTWTVPLTRGVMAAIGSGRLIEVAEPEPPVTPATPPSPESAAAVSPSAAVAPSTPATRRSPAKPRSGRRR